MVSEAPVLIYYDTSKPLIHCDACGKSLRAALLSESQPLTFIYWVLRDTVGLESETSACHHFVAMGITLLLLLLLFFFFFFFLFKV